MKRLAFVVASISALQACKTASQHSEEKFNAAEHKMLGDQGFARSCTAFGSVCPAKLTRLNKKKDFTYGELVAFSGDFYKSWTDIYEATSDAYPMVAGWLTNWDKVVEAKKLFSLEEDAIREMQRNPEKDYPDFNIKFTTAFGLEYVEMAKDNTSHFGWHNIKHYIANHEKALELAIMARNGETVSEGKAQRKITLTEALFANGFADHFLTDGFAAGHVRMPRKEAMAWGKARGYSESAMGVLAKLIHDNDPCVYKQGLANVCQGESDPSPHLHHGALKVRNANGDNWIARADGDLYRASEQTETHVMLPIRAVEASVAEVLEAYKTGKTPTGPYAALQYVPFVSPDEKPIHNGFAAVKDDKEILALLSSVGILGKTAGRFVTDLRDPKKTSAYFNALEGIMADFRANVKGDIDGDENLRKRVPEALLNGYFNVR